MISDLDIYRTAHLLLAQYAESAEDYALARYEEHLQREDVHGAGVWLGVANAIAELSKIDITNATIH